MGKPFPETFGVLFPWRGALRTKISWKRLHHPWMVSVSEKKLVMIRKRASRSNPPMILADLLKYFCPAVVGVAGCRRQRKQDMLVPGRDRIARIFRYL